MLRLATVFGVLALATLALANLSFDAGPPELSGDPQGRGTFTFAVTNDPGNLDPGRTSASTDFRVVKLIYEPLLVVKWGGDGIEPGTAKDMPAISSDGLTYTFTLRDDAKWSDGKPVTAGDFVYAWRRAMLNETASDYSSLFYIIEGVTDFIDWRDKLVNLDASFENKADRDAFIAPYPELVKLIGQATKDPSAKNKQAVRDLKWQITKQEFDKRVGVKALDDRTLEIKLKSPTAYFIDLCAFPTFSPLPRHVLEPMQGIDDAGVFLPFDYFGNPDKLITNGPYTLAQWKRKVRMVFDQNPHYWNRDAMGNIQIVEETIPDQSLQLLRFEEGLIDWIPDVGELKKKLLDIEYPHAQSVPTAGTYYYQFNCRETLPSGVKNPMADARVRRAMAMCINRQELVDFVTRGNEPVANLVVPDKEIPGYTGPHESAVKFDPNGAKKLLAEAGYPGGKGFPPIQILINNDAGGAGHANIALAIKKNWEDMLGLKVSLDQVEFKVLLDRSKSGNFFTRRAGWFGDYADPTTWLDMHRKTDSNNDGKYDNPAYDKLLADAALELDKAKRFEMLAQAEAMLMQDAPIVPLYYYNTMLIFDKSKIDMGANAWNNFRLELVKVKRKE